MNKMNSPILSIIVPVYNVEQYLHRCIDSILTQTFTDFELILVDDGSTDKSGILCDKYSLKDSRIKVIHKKNEGVSEARNVALDIAKGRYITFVDSDDEYGNVNILYENVKILEEDRNIDIIQFPYKTSSNDNIYCFTGYIKGKENIYKALFDENIINGFPWNKIYKSEIFSDLRYPKDQRFEDIYLLYDIIEKICCIYCSDKGFYLYNIRNNSFSNCKYTIKKYKDEFLFLYKGIKQVSAIRCIKRGKMISYIYFFHTLICAQKEFGITEFYDDIVSFNSIKLSIKDIIFLLARKNLKDSFAIIIAYFLGFKIYVKILTFIKNK